MRLSRTALRLGGLTALAWSLVTAAAAQPTAPKQAGSSAVVPSGSPRATVQAFRDAAHSGRWDDAAPYLQLDQASAARGPELARRLNAVLESLWEFDPETVSASPDGNLQDGLPADVEQIGRFERLGSPRPIRLLRLSQDGAPRWVFTASTVGQIDRWYDRLYSQRLRDYLAASRLRVLLREGPFDIYYWQWLAFPLAALLSWLVSWIFHRAMRPVMAWITSRTATRLDDRIVASIGPPLALAIGALVFTMLAVLTDLNRDALRGVVFLVRPLLAFALTWALWRLTAVLLAWAAGRSWALNRPSARNILAIGTNIVRAVIVSLGIVGVLAAAGFPVGTVIAGLGIGGVALAFGAQKTVENLFGSISMALDQPIRVGDFVKVQDVTGTVEDIGIRSTRIRTLDRTVITIPNGKLADERLESFEVRDRTRFFAALGLSYDTTRAQMLQVLGGIEQVLGAHPKIWRGGYSVGFVGLGDSALKVEVSAWFAVTDSDEFQACRQQVLLEIIDAVARAGTSFAFPTRTIHVADERRPPVKDGATTGSPAAIGGGDPDHTPTSLN